MTCTVEFGTAVMNSDLLLLVVNAQLFRDGTLLSPLTGPTMDGTTTTRNFTTTVTSFVDSYIGNYTCRANVTRQRPTATSLIGMGQGQSDPVEIVIGRCTNTIVVLSDKFKLCPVLYFVLGIPPTTQPSGGNTGGSNAGAIAGGVIVVIISLAAVGVALAFFIFWFL